MAGPREAGLPRERPDTLPSQQPTAAQRMLFHSLSETK